MSFKINVENLNFHFHEKKKEHTIYKKKEDHTTSFKEILEKEMKKK